MERLQSIGRDSRVWAIALLAVLLIGFVRTTQAHGPGVQRTMDSPGYETQAETPLSLAASLSSQRTPLYPKFLRYSSLLGDNYRALPAVQYLIFGASAFLLFACCRRAGFRAWEAFLVTAPLGSATVPSQYGSTIAPEVIAISFAFVAFGVSLILAARGLSWQRNATFSATVFLACLARPSFLFLPLACSLAIALMTPSVNVIPRRRRIGKELFVNLLSSSLPLLCYAVLRLLIVGDFGVVSFGGATLAGFGTNPRMLTPAIASRLESPEMRGLAQAILAKREAVVAGESKASPLTSLEDSNFAGGTELERLIGTADRSVWEVAVPAAKAYYNDSSISLFDPDWVMIDSKLRRLSSLTLSENKSTYARWVGLSAKHMVVNVFSYETAGRGAVVICLAALLLCTLIAAIRQKDASTRTSQRSLVWIVTAEAAALGVVVIVALVKRIALPGLYPLSIAFFCLAIAARTFWRRGSTKGTYEATGHSRAYAYTAFAFLFFSAGVLLTALVTMPLRRYIIAISPLLPGAILLVSVRWMVTLWPSKRGMPVQTTDSH